MRDTEDTTPEIRSEDPHDRRHASAGRKRNRRLRLAGLVTVLVAVTAIGTAHQLLGAPKPVGVDALCPLGGLETLWSLLVGGGYIKRVAASSLILLVVSVGLALVLRRTFCGYLCPFGALQELLARLSLAIGGKRRFEVPPALDRPARFLKYGVLALFTLWTWQAADLVIRPYDPWVAFMHVTSSELLAEFAVGTVILAVTVVGSAAYDRFFCKYLCPTGALLGIVSKVAPFAVTRDAVTCTDCRACDRACPVNIEVSTATRVTSAECISCNECVNVCPSAGTLSVSAGSLPEARRLSPMLVLGATVAAFAVLIGVTSVTGAFAWTVGGPPKLVPGQVLDVGEIRGRMSFAEISAATGIPEHVFKERFGVADADMNTKIAQLAPVYGFDVHTDVREFIAEQLNVPYDAGTAEETGSHE